MANLVDSSLMGITPEKVLAFEVPEDLQERAEHLMARHHNSSITAEEKAELDYYLEFEQLMRLMKARAARVLAIRAA